LADSLHQADCYKQTFSSGNNVFDRLCRSAVGGLSDGEGVWNCRSGGGNLFGGVSNGTLHNMGALAFEMVERIIEYFALIITWLR
jgi:hypothetical protein